MSDDLASFLQEGEDASDDFAHFMERLCHSYNVPERYYLLACQATMKLYNRIPDAVQNQLRELREEVDEQINLRREVQRALSGTIGQRDGEIIVLRETLEERTRMARQAW